MGALNAWRYPDALANTQPQLAQRLNATITSLSSFSSRPSPRCRSPGPLIIASLFPTVAQIFTHLPTRIVLAGPRMENLLSHHNPDPRKNSEKQHKEVSDERATTPSSAQASALSLSSAQPSRVVHSFPEASSRDVSYAFMLSLHTCRHGTAQGQVQASCGFPAALAKRSRCRRQLPAPGPFRA